MYSWGRASDGQLGLGGIQETIVSSPRWNKHVAEKSIRHVACSLKHSLLLTDGGIVHSCGSNEKGQLGQDETSTRPGKLGNAASEAWMLINSLSLSSTCLQYSLQFSPFVSLSHNYCSILAPVISLESRKISQVCCGNVHSIAVDCHGQLLSWGGNQYGQLGYGGREGMEVNFVPK